MKPAVPHPVVHLELHTGDLERAQAFYADLCGWRPEQIRYGDQTYVALDLAGELSGGIVECCTERALWLPYVEVEDIISATKGAELAGASILLSPREGPAGWRSVVRSPAGGEIAFWQPKR
jgi:predicted enzyme related to lactoylglutathione lyase